MKRVLTMLLTAALLLSLAGCGEIGTEDPNASATTTSTEPTKPTAVLQDQLAQVMEATHYDWVDELPRMDGSTSTIPLEAGIRAALFGTSQEEAELQVSHSTTYGSFYNLIDKKCDLIFSVPLSDKQITEAREKGMELEMTKIAAEGFVFVVNAQNPVDTLTQQQLKDIYSGKITNWSEVGGNDAPIIAYQRNETSGSQNFMHTFMGDTPLMDPRLTSVDNPETMGALMDAVAYYDNAENAIGYSVYAYAADMYGNGNEIKFIHVDGVEPTKATMADGSYPLLSYNYAVYDAATPADSSLRKLVEWIGTDEGQRAVKAAGYVPLRPVEEMKETTVALYSAVGTGKKKSENYQLALDRYTADLSDATTSKQDENGDWIYINALKNTTLQDEINAFIKQSVQEVKAALSEDQPETLQAITDMECINGYLSVRVSLNREEAGYRTALYDLVAGKRIAFSDLFYEGEEFVDTINRQLQSSASRLRDIYYGEEELVDDRATKRDFAGIPAGHDGFSLSSVIFSPNNLYFSGRAVLGFRGLRDKMVVYEPRDMSGLFEDHVKICREFNWEVGKGTEEPLVFDEYGVTLMDDTAYDPAVCEKVNTAIRALCADHYSREATAKRFHAVYGGSGDVNITIFYMNFQTIGDQYIHYYSTALVSGNADGGRAEKYCGIELFFDAKTGEEVPYTTFLKDGWQQSSRWVEGDIHSDADFFPDSQPTVSAPSLDGAVLYCFEMGYRDQVQLIFGRPNTGESTVIAYVPEEYVNWDL